LAQAGRGLRFERLETRRLLAAGDLDPTFDADGIVTTDFLNLSPTDSGSAVVIQSDGKMVVAGTSSGDFAVLRYNSDGTLDTSFGGGDGKVSTAIGALTDSASSCYSSRRQDCRGRLQRQWHKQ
jgi:uncharacterized delta-60 repeat protein